MAEVPLRHHPADNRWRPSTALGRDIPVSQRCTVEGRPELQRTSCICSGRVETGKKILTHQLECRGRHSLEGGSSCCEHNRIWLSRCSGVLEKRTGAPSDMPICLKGDGWWDLSAGVPSRGGHRGPDAKRTDEAGWRPPKPVSIAGVMVRVARSPADGS